MRAARFAPVPLVVALALVAPVRAVQAATTVGLWHMDSGPTAVDSSGHHNDGHLQNVQVASGTYDFNGHSSRVLVPDDPSLDPGSGDITISVKVKFTARPSHSVHDYDVIRKGGNGSFYKIEITNTGRARCQFHGSSGAQGIVLGPDLSNGQWHTIECTKTSSKIEGRVDGHAASHNAHIGSISNGTALSFGGKSSGSQDLYQGQMDEVRITIG
jgi:sialidase-1